MSTMRTIALALRDQLRTKINGSTGYSFRLNQDQVVLADPNEEDIKKYPMVCITSALSRFEPATIRSTHTATVEVGLYGYVQTGNDNALEEVMKLSEDIAKALRVDTDLGLGSVVIGMHITEVHVGAKGNLGICRVAVELSYYLDRAT